VTSDVEGTGKHRRRAAWSLSGWLVVALAVVAAALALPAPKELSPPREPGPTRLSDVWPAVKPVTLSSNLPDGASYTPLFFLDANTSVGLATSSDLASASLLIRVGEKVTRQLRVLRGLQRPTVAGVTAVGDRLYWIETGEDSHGKRQTTVWRADLSGGAARKLATDSSDVLYFDSNYDLQVSDGSVYWAAAGQGAIQAGEIRSVPVDGGPVRVRPLDRLYALTVWPWATSGGNGQPGEIDLLNLRSGERRTVAAGPDEILNCTPTWCRVTTLVNQGQSLTVEIERTDGSDRRGVGDTSLMPLNTDVALAGRFEVLAGAASANAAATAQRLWLYDLTTNRAVLLAEAATAGIGSRGQFLWWSTGDNETLVWHVLDLQQLGGSGS